MGKNDRVRIAYLMTKVHEQEEWSVRAWQVLNKRVELLEKMIGVSKDGKGTGD